MTTDATAFAHAYSEGELLPDPLPTDPMPLLKAWLDEAVTRDEQPNPNAMTLATADTEGRPSARIVLCKDLRPDPGIVVFYTNYQGRKGRELEANPRGSLVFHWDHTDRQARVEGPVVRAPDAESDAYFKTRRWESRLGAWTSDQSEPIGSRDELIAKAGEKAMDLGLDITEILEGDPETLEIPRPPHWGGYHVRAERVELWCGGVGRVHDRAEWRRELTTTGETFTASPWSSTRLQP